MSKPSTADQAAVHEQTLSVNPTAESAQVPQKRKPIWINILFMTLTPIAALIFVPIYFVNHGFSWGMLAFFCICYMVNNMSITSAYHRYFAHRSHEVHPIIEKLYIFIAAGAFQGSVLQWCTDHRRHHREVDTDGDPYSINKGFWYAHLLWMFSKDQHPQAEAWPKDLTKNKWVMFQHKYYGLIATFMGFFFPAIIGWAIGFGFWGSLVICGLLRIVLTQHSTFLINSACHMFGRQTYTDKNTARDSFIMAVLTFGEGYHNFHHFFQADYRNGTRWYHWDPTKWWIRALAFFGLAKRLKRAQKEEILRARLAMEERVMLAKGAPVEKVVQLKAHIEEAQRRLKALREAYILKKREVAARGRAWKRHMRAEIRLAENEFRFAYGQWRTYRRVVKRTPLAA